MHCFFVTDIHGKVSRYENLFSKIIEEKPDAVFIGGDILPSIFNSEYDDFISDYLAKEILSLKKYLKDYFPDIFIILGNDDPRIYEEDLKKIEARDKLWYYMHMRKIQWKNYNVYGYSMIPPTPFLFKDWEKYDVSQYVDPGCVHPTEGYRSVDAPKNLKYSSIKDDLSDLCGETKQQNSIFLFHTPPYDTNLDRAALDGKMIEYVPLDVHVGSIAVKRFIEDHEPLLSLHGHIHESTKLTGIWSEKINNTWAFNGANDTQELCIITFDPENLENAKRVLL